MQIVKLGGSIITDKAGFEKANLPAIRLLCRQLAIAYKKGERFIVVHGAGSFGHPHVIKYKIKNGVHIPRQATGFCKTHESVAGLSALVTSELTKAGVPCVSLPPLAISQAKNGKLDWLCTDAIDALLAAGITPILYGDVITDTKQGGAVLSGDTIMKQLAPKAKQLLFVTNTDGIYAGKVLLKEINSRNAKAILKHVGDSRHKDVTGGMRGKLLEILSTGKPSYIVNGKHPTRLLNLMLGKKDVCTRIN